MSGLEPLVALGLACNIFQLIEVGRDTIKLAKGIYQSSTPSIDKALEENAVILDNISREVKAAKRPTRPSKLEQQLLVTAERCSSAARDLEEEVSFLLENAKRNQLVSTLKAVARTTWRKRRLDRLREGLENAEKLMKTTLLAQIWSRTRATQLDLSNVEDNIRTFILEYRSGSRDIKQLVSGESLRTREHISASSKETMQAIGGIQKTLNTLTLGADVQVDQARRENLLQSLKFPGFNERRNQIAEAYEKTFHWIFMGDDGPSLEAPMGSDSEDSDWEDSDLEDVDLADPAEASWDLFSNWLSSTARIYWISGKPGSGKTTLVKYILNHPKTATYLDIWSPRALTISHFFWRPGNEMQQSIKGLLCSLLYQLLDNSEAATNYLFRRARRGDLGAKDDYTDWSVPELRSIFLSILSSYEHPVLIIIDGLDEVHPADGSLELLDLVEQFPRYRNTKLCLASRPEPTLQRRLSAYPHLRLQDLTRADLDRYARAHIKLTGAIDDEEFCNISRSSNEPWDLFESIVDKAEGVFLWLILAIKSINKGSTYGDTRAMVEQRMNSLPGDLTKLYVDMWERACEDSPKAYRQTASLHLRLILLAPPFPVINGFPRLSTILLMLASTSIAGQLLDAIENPLNLVPEERLLKQCRDLERKVKSYCFGLVEFATESCGENVHGWYGSKYDRLWSCFGQRYPRFIHRTAEDFLLDTVDGKEILGHDVSSESALLIRWFKAQLAHSQLYYDTPLVSDREQCMHIHVVRRVKVYREVLHVRSETSGPYDTDWTNAIFYLERMCSSGQILSETYGDKLRSCGGADFLKAAASICCNESIWPAVRMVPTVAVSEMLLELCDSYIYPVNRCDFTNLTVTHGITSMLRAGADPNWSGTAFSSEGFYRGGYLQIMTPFTAYLNKVTQYLDFVMHFVIQGGRNILRLEQNRIAEVLRNLDSFLTHSAHLGTMLTLSFRYVGSDNGCRITFDPRMDLDLWANLGSPGHPYFHNTVTVSCTAYTVLQILLDYIGKNIERPRCSQEARYEEIMSLTDSLQKRLDCCSKLDDSHVVGMFGSEHFGESHGLENHSRTREPFWYVPAKEGPTGIANELQKELCHWLNLENSFRSKRCRTMSQLVQTMSWTIQAEGFDRTWESLAQLGILARPDYEWHDIQGWVDKFQKQRCADGSFSDGVEVAQSCLGSLNM